MFKKILHQSIALTLGVSIIIFIIIIAFINIFQGIDATIGDNYYQSIIGEKLKVDSRIKIVGIDEKTLKKLGRFPFDRKAYIPVIQNLKKAGASVIGLDIIFAETSQDKNSDEVFAQAVKQAGNIIIGGASIFSEIHSKGKFLFEKPYKQLEKAALGIGFFTVKENEYNKKIYSINTESWYSLGEKHQHFTIKILKAYYSFLYKEDYLSYNRKEGKDYYISPRTKIPIIDYNDFYINYANSKKIEQYSFIDIYNNNFNSAIFKDSIVIIGSVAKGMNDVFDTPNGQQYGVLIHANIINTVLTKNYKIYFNKYLELLLLFFLIILSVHINLSLSGKRLIIGNIVVIFLFMGIIYFIVHVGENILNYMAEFIFSLFITLAISNILKSFIESQNKETLNKALGEYLSENIAEDILNGKWKSEAKGIKKRISIFFSDIEGFTSFSETMEPEFLVLFLREYLGAMSHIILDNKGFIDKYEGDAIMALWGAFGKIDLTQITYLNCLSALQQQKALHNLNKQWGEKYGQQLHVRMGIHTGNAIIGNIGAIGRKVEFTALGDSVNLASRLEGVNKFYGTYICTSEEVYKEQKEQFEFRYLDNIRVKGKKNPIKIYELLAKKGETTQREKNMNMKFSEAIKLYLQRDFEKAIHIFKPLSISGDPVSSMYMHRCEEYTHTPPESHWDGVWNLEHK